MEISILVYKLEYQEGFFILDTPKELVDLGYETECDGCDSMLFDRNGIESLKGKEKGLYKLTMFNDLNYEQIKDKANNHFWFCFKIKDIKKVEIS